MRLRKSAPKNTSKQSNVRSHEQSSSRPNSSFLMTAYSMYLILIAELGHEPAGLTPEELISGDIAVLMNLTNLQHSNTCIKYASFLINAHNKIHKNTQIFQ